MTSSGVPPRDLGALQAEWTSRETLRSVLSMQFANGAAVRVGAVFERFVLERVAAEIANRTATMPRGRAFVDHRRAIFMQKAIRQIVSDGSKRARAKLLQEARDLAGTEVTYLARAGAASFGSQWSTPAPSLVEAAITKQPMLGRPFGDWFQDWVPKQTEARIVGRVRAGMVAGESTEQIVRALQGTRAAGFANGELAAPRRAVAMLTRTTMTHTANQARELTYLRNRDVVGKVGWLSVLDLRTTKQCAALDGQEWRVDEPHPTPPIHPNCRSTLLAIVGPRIGFRAAQGGRVSAEQDYADWLRTRSHAEQDLVLGKRVGAAWRAGKLTLKQMVDATMRRALTIPELEAAGLL